MIPRTGALAKSRFDNAECELAIRDLIKSGEAVPAGGHVVAGARWDDWASAAVDAVDAYHAAHPEHAGVPLARLRGLRGIPELLLDPLLDWLCGDDNGDDFVRRSTCLARRTHRPALSPRLQGVAETIRRRLAERQPLDPPSRRALAADDAAFQALRFLIAGGEVIELGPDVVVTADGYAEAASRIAAHLAERGGATVSQLKELLGSNRRVMVPLLERLDRDGLTIRRGDLRVLRGGKS